MDDLRTWTLQFERSNKRVDRQVGGRPKSRASSVGGSSMIGGLKRSSSSTVTKMTASTTFLSHQQPDGSVYSSLPENEAVLPRGNGVLVKRVEDDIRLSTPNSLRRSQSRSRPSSAGSSFDPEVFSHHCFRCPNCSKDLYAPRESGLLLECPHCVTLIWYTRAMALQKPQAEGLAQRMHQQVGSRAPPKPIAPASGSGSQVSDASGMSLGAWNNRVMNTQSGMRSSNNTPSVDLNHVAPQPQVASPKKVSTRAKAAGKPPRGPELIRKNQKAVMFTDTQGHIAAEKAKNNQRIR